MPTRNIKLTLSYDGTDFHGWQIQPERPTIQGVLSEAIEKITGEKVLPQGSGRTDAGVHALAQVASFATTSSIPLDNLRKALNSCLPASIRIMELSEAQADFHPRYDARAKTYEYRIFRGEVCPPFLVRYVHHYPYPMKQETLQMAAAAVIGEHDFTSFAAVDPEKRSAGDDRLPLSSVRTVFSSAWHIADDIWTYRIRGNGFLHHMVRNLVGTFVLIGKGGLLPQDIARIINARDRSAAGPTAPPEGLFLISVEY